MIIAGLQKTTLIDYPGKVACTVFLAGCNFKCPWCYSSELVLPERIKKLPKISQKDFFKFLKNKKGLLDGVVICGGEPTLNKDLPEFLARIKKQGFLAKLDTNGTNPKMLASLIKQELVDYVAMDIKAPLRTNPKAKIPYEEATGAKANLENIKKSVAIIKKSGLDYEFRTTVVPGIHSKEDILEMAGALAPAKAYFLQSFRPEKTLKPGFTKIKPYPKTYLLEIKKEVSRFFRICEVR